MVTPGPFLCSNEGEWFRSVLRNEVAPCALRLAAGWGLPYSGADEAVNTIIVFLANDPARCAYLVENAADPITYLRTYLPEWVGIDTGRKTYATSNGKTDRIRASSSRRRAYFSPIDSPHTVLPAWTISDPQLTRRAAGLPTIDEAVASTVTTLYDRTPTRLRNTLPDLVSWLAHNPTSRKGHEADVLDAAVETFRLHPGEVHAVANISWGGRPNRAATSLLGAFLLNAEFDPRDSATHVRALRHYMSRVNAPSLTG